ACLLVDLIPARALQVEDSREQFLSDIERHDPPHHTSHFGIKERSYQLPDQGLAGNIIGVEYEHDLRIHISHGVLESCSLAGFAADSMKRSNASGVAGYIAVDDLSRTIDGAVVYWYDGQPLGWIIDLQQSGENVGHHRFLVVS